MRRTLWLIFVLFVVGLLLSVGTLAGLRYHDGFRDLVLLQLIKPYGVNSLSTKLESLSFDHIAVESLAISYESNNIAAQGKALQIRLQRADATLPFADPQSWSLTLGNADATVATLKAEKTAGPEQAFSLASLLPQSILKQVPLAAIQVQALSLEYKPPGGDSWRYQGQSYLSPQKIESRFQLHHGEQPFSGELLLNSENVDVTLGQKDQPWVSIKSRLELVDARLVAGGNLTISDLTHAEDWLLLLPVELPEIVNWQGKLDLAFTLGVPEARLQEWLTGDTSRLEGVTLASRVQHDIRLGVPALEVTQLAAKGSASVQLNGDSLQIKPWELESGKVSMTLTDPDLLKRLALSRPGTLTLTGKGRLMELEAAVTGGEVNTVSGKLQATLALPQKPALTGYSTFNVRRTKAAAFKGRADVLLRDLTEFASDFTYTPAQQALEFKINSKKTRLATTTFNEWVKKLELPFQLELGDFTMVMEGRVDVNKLKQARVKGNLEVSDWHGKLEKNRFKSLTSRFAFSGDMNHFSLKGEVRNGLFDIGIPITDIRYDLAIDSDTGNQNFQISVTNLESKLVGGLVRVPEFTWNNKQQETRFNVVIFNWQFAQIIELLDRDDLEVSGILDGMLPVYVVGRDWGIRDGRLTARKPGGVIRYKPDKDMKAYLSNQEQLKMAVNILENFHYQTLDAVVNQELDGTQYINLSLKGKNPDMVLHTKKLKVQGGTPANLNLNIEHNIKPLLESLSLPGKIKENWKDLDSVKK